MKGFIEIRDIYGKLALIQVEHIKSVTDKAHGEKPNGYRTIDTTTTVIKTDVSYETLVKLMEEAR